MRSRRAVVVLLGAALPTCLAALATGVPRATWSRLPARLADHWGLSGRPDGAEPKLVAFGIVVALAAFGSAILALWMVRGLKSLRRASEDTPRSGPPRSGAGLLASGLVLAALGAAVSIAMTLANLGLHRWQDARLSPVGFVLIIPAPLALAAAGTSVARRTNLLVTTTGTDRRREQRLGLADGERALWLGSARSAWAGPVAVVGFAGAVLVGSLAAPALAVPIVALSLATLELSSVHVRAGATGVATRFGPLAWPVVRIPLGRIVHAEALEVAPRSWGYRGSVRLFGAAAVIIRRGAALHLVLEANKTFLVTVDDASTAAALVNDEIERSNRPRPPTA